MIFIRRIRQNPSYLKGEKSTALDLARGRLMIVLGCFIVAYLLLALRAVDLTVLQAQAIIPDLRVADRTMESPERKNIMRADIMDRNGVMLATTLKTASLFADSRFIAEPKKTAKALKKIFPDLKYGETLQKLQSGKSFIWLKRNITPHEQKRVLEIGEPGLAFEKSTKRFYPQEGLAGHLLGYTNIDNNGLYGVERSFDAYLSKYDDPLRLSVDVRFQHALHREVLAAKEEFKALGAAGVIMDVNTGEILAGISLPDFNPHNASRASENESFSRLTQGAYELGSVFKIFSTAAFLENSNLPMSTTFDAREPIKIGGFRINDFHAQKRVLTIPEVFMHSSNIGTAMMAQAVGGDALQKFYTDLGLLDPMQFEIKEVARPQIPNPWREISTLTASYGHGVTTTPLQIASAVSTTINGGTLVKPKLVLSDEPDNSPEIRVLSEATSHKMRQLMRIVVSEGTGSKAAVKGYKVGGKTGTAEKIINGRYDDDKKISSFVGVFPMDAPKYVVYIMVDEPIGHKGTWGYATGGWVAAPAVARTIASIAAIEGIMPYDEGEQDFASSLKQYIAVEEGR
ncbi:MAG: peptidoglycan D,D-transpeptidase FtsI family protein [Bdellovibrionales bacterium]